MPTSFPSWVKLGWRDTSEKPTPVIARSEVERGIPRHRRTAADSLVTVPLTAYFDTALEADAFESWFFGEALAGAEWFSFTLPRNGQVVQARFKDGDIGPLKPTTKTFAFSERSFELEYVRPGFRTLPPGLHSVTPAQVLQVQRASTATFVDAAGVLQRAAAHVPRFTYFSGKNIYSGPVDLVAGPGVYGVVHFLKTANNNPVNFQPGEVLTVSAQVYQDVANISDGQARIARLYFWSENSANVWQQYLFIDGAVLSPSGRISAIITLPVLASGMTRVGVGIYHQPGDLSFDLGTVRADAVMVERGAVATAYEPGARLLVEAAATNLLFPSEPTVAQVPTLSNVTNAAAQYPGFQRSLLFPANGTISFAYLSRALDAGQQFTFSVFVKIAGVPVFTGGTAGSADGALTFGSNVLSVANVQHVGGDLWRIWVTGTGPGAGLNLGVVKYATNSAKPFWVMGYQLNAGATPQGYAVSTTAPATRAADVIQVTA